MSCNNGFIIFSRLGLEGAQNNVHGLLQLLGLLGLLQLLGLLGLLQLLGLLGI